MTELSRLGSYLIVRTLRQGLYFKLKLGRYLETGQLVALKILKEKSYSLTSQLIVRLRNEVDALAALSHPNILESVPAMEYGTYLPKSNRQSYPCVYKVLEYCPMDLFTLTSSLGKLKESVARKIFIQVIDMLQYIHQHGICHRNVKLDHLLLSSNGEVKITGFSSCSKYREQTTGPVNTDNYYSAPELLSYRQIDLPAVDLYAAGVVLFTLVTGISPFSRASYTDYMYTLLIQNPHRYWKNLERTIQLSEELKDLLQTMLSDSVLHRPSISEIKSHPWMVKSIPTSQEMIQIIRDLTVHRSNSDPLDQTRQNTQNIAEILPSQLSSDHLSQNMIEVGIENPREAWDKLIDLLRKNEVKIIEIPENCTILCRTEGLQNAFSVILYGFRKHHAVELNFRRRFRNQEIRKLIQQGMGVT